MDNKPQDTENLGWADEQFNQRSDIPQVLGSEMADSRLDTPLQQAVGAVALVNTQTSGTETIPTSVRWQRTADYTSATATYLDQIGETPLLTADDERELAQAIEAGAKAKLKLTDGEVTDKQVDHYQLAIKQAGEAKQRFIKANLRLVVSIAKKYPVPNSMEMLDLIQDGNLGLEHAVDMFDWRKGFKFSTYATYWIRQSIRRSLDVKTNLIRIPVVPLAGLRDAIAYVDGNIDALDERNSRLYKFTTPLYLDKKVSDDTDSNLHDVIEDTNTLTPEESLFGAFDNDLLDGLLSQIDSHARYVIAEIYGLDGREARSVRSVATELGVSADSVRRIIRNSMGRMRNSFLAQRSSWLDNSDQM